MNKINKFEKALATLKKLCNEEGSCRICAYADLCQSALGIICPSDFPVFNEDE